MRLTYEQFKHFTQQHCKLNNEVWQGPITLLPWHEKLLQPLIDGNFREAYCFLPRQQGKSLLFCAYALAELLAHDGGEIYLLSATTNQSKHNFQIIEEFYWNDPALQKVLWLRHHLGEIWHIDPKTNRRKGLLKILSSDPRKGGFSSNLILVDELAEFGSTARTIWEKIKGCGAARPNSKIVVISTAQANREHIGYELFQLAREIKHDPRHPLKDIILPVIVSGQPRGDLAGLGPVGGNGGGGRVWLGGGGEWGRRSGRRFGAARGRLRATGLPALGEQLGKAVGG